MLHLDLKDNLRLVSDVTVSLNRVHLCCCALCRELLLDFNGISGRFPSEIVGLDSLVCVCPTDCRSLKLSHKVPHVVVFESMWIPDIVFTHDLS
jgi:hypothetical protein